MLIALIEQQKEELAQHRREMVKLRAQQGAPEEREKKPSISCVSEKLRRPHFAMMMSMKKLTDADSGQIERSWKNPIQTGGLPNRPLCQVDQREQDATGGAHGSQTVSGGGPRGVESLIEGVEARVPAGSNGTSTLARGSGRAMCCKTPAVDLPVLPQRENQQVGGKMALGHQP